jgi:hypothetical protein
MIKKRDDYGKQNVLHNLINCALSILTFRCILFKKWFSLENKIYSAQKIFGMKTKKMVTEFSTIHDFFLAGMKLRHIFSEVTFSMVTTYFFIC